MVCSTWQQHIKRKTYKTVCAELAFAKVTMDKIVMSFYSPFTAVEGF